MSHTANQCQSIESREVPWTITITNVSNLSLQCFYLIMPLSSTLKIKMLSFFSQHQEKNKVAVKRFITYKAVSSLIAKMIFLAYQPSLWSPYYPLIKKDSRKKTIFTTSVCWTVKSRGHPFLAQFLAPHPPACPNRGTCTWEYILLVLLANSVAPSNILTWRLLRNDFLYKKIKVGR